MSIERVKKLYDTLLDSINFKYKNFDKYFKDKAKYEYENLMRKPTGKNLENYANSTEKLIGEMKRVGKIYRIYK